MMADEQPSGVRPNDRIVAPAWRRLGMGRRLFGAVLRWATDRGRNRLEWQERVAAVSFRERVVDFRLYRRIVEVRDGVLLLRPSMEPRAAAYARELAVTAGLPETEARDDAPT